MDYIHQSNVKVSYVSPSPQKKAKSKPTLLSPSPQSIIIMDGDESAALTSYYHHHHPQPSTTTSSTANGVFSSDLHQHSNQSTTTAPHYEQPPPLTYPTQQHSLRPPPPPQQPQPPLSSPPPPASSQIAPPPESVKRKRGRPRKYGTPETPQSAVKKLLSSSPSSTSNLPSSPRKKDGSLVNSSKKNQLVALGNAGQNFVPHIITVTAGEDVYQKIMSFTQQRKRAVCILSASGSISNASLRQPATLGGTVTYEGRFEILSLSGSYLHTETEGGGSTRKGGLSVCLSNTDGRIIGGSVGGPLTAAGPVQVIIGSFVVEANKETNVDVKYETSSSSKLPQVIGTTFSSVVYNNDHQNFGVNNYVFQTQGMHSMPSQSPDWRDNTDLGACQSSEDGDDGDLHH